MKVTIEGYDEIREKMKGVRPPSRRRLASEPWDEEQLRIFCMRQSSLKPLSPTEAIPKRFRSGIAPAPEHKKIPRRSVP